MLLTLFNIFLSIIELLQLILEINREFFQIIKRTILSPERKNVNGETVIITGGSKGLGRELALKFSQLGAKVIILDIDQINGNDLVNNINNNNSSNDDQTTQSSNLNSSKQAVFIKCDVSNYDEVKRAFDEIIEKNHNIDILINNAGICNNYPLTEINHKSIIKTINTNLLSHLFTVKLALPKMFKQKKGHIVAIASNFGLVGRANFTDYTATKFGLVGFYESLEDEMREYRKDFIRFTTICPAAIETGLTKTIPNRFPKLFPIMSASYAASKIVDAILKEENFYILPIGYKVLYTILLRLPRKIRRLFLDYLGSTAQPNHSLNEDVN